jgi:prepilin signal peptidase PulO-like enzyme (type II secretory pathway)
MTTKIPFGPYLILGCLFYLIFSDKITKIIFLS